VIQTASGSQLTADPSLHFGELAVWAQPNFRTAATVSLFDDIICNGEQRWWHSQTKGFGRPEVDDHLDLGSLQLATLTIRHAVPAIYGYGEFAKAGGLTDTNQPTRC
jgi:hypothetical protein